MRLLFGPETRGLPDEILDSLAGDNKLRMPMVSTSRSLNLSNTVSIAVYEAWRQQEVRAAAIKQLYKRFLLAALRAALEVTYRVMRILAIV